MTTQYIKVASYWNVLVYYNTDFRDLPEIEDSLMQLNCPEEDIDAAMNVLYKTRNTGFTYSNSDYRMSVVCISQTTSARQFVNTAVHEAKHVQSHICSYYDIDEDSEEAAYLIGFIVSEMYRMVSKVIKHYVRYIGR